jgi:hypothetical protein
MVEQISDFGGIDLIAGPEREKTLADATFERTELDESVDVTDEAVAEGIESMVVGTLARLSAIGTATELMQRDLNPERALAIATLKTDVLSALQLATGEPAPSFEALGVESQWIMEQIEAGLVADGSGYSESFAVAQSEPEGAPDEAPSPEAAEPYDPSANEAMAARSAEMLTFFESYRSQLSGHLNSDLGRQALAVFGITGEEVLNGVNSMLTNPTDIAQHTLAIRQVEFWQEHETVLQQVFAGEATQEQLVAINEASTQFFSSLRTELHALSQQHGVAMPGLPSMSGDVSPEVLNGDLSVLFDSVSDMMQSMFSEEYEAWKTALRAPGAMRISFEDYLRQNDDGNGLMGIDLKIQLAKFGEMWADIMKMFGIATGTAEDTEVVAEVPTDPEQMTEAQIEAAGGREAAEANFQAERLTDVTAYFESAGAPVISNFYEVNEEGDLVYSHELAEAYLALSQNRAVTADSIEETVNVIKTNVTPLDKANQILQQGLSFGALNQISSLPATAITAVDDNGITIGTNKVEFEPSGTFGARLQTQVDAFRTNETNDANEAVQRTARNTFINGVAKKVAADAMGSGWDGNDVIDNGGGFTIDESGFAVVDIAQHTTIFGDWSADHVEFSIPDEFGSLDEIGYSGKSWADVESDLEKVLSDQYLSELISKNDWVTSIA